MQWKALGKCSWGVEGYLWRTVWWQGLFLLNDTKISQLYHPGNPGSGWDYSIKEKTMNFYLLSVFLSEVQLILIWLQPPDFRSGFQPLPRDGCATDLWGIYIQSGMQFSFREGDTVCVSRASAHSKPINYPWIWLPLAWSCPFFCAEVGGEGFPGISYAGAKETAGIPFLPRIAMKTSLFLFYYCRANIPFSSEWSCLKIPEIRKC